MEDKATASSWRIRASEGRTWHGSRGWPARGPRLTGGGDACVRRRTEQGGGREGEADGRVRRGKKFISFFSLGCDSSECWSKLESDA